MRALTVQQPWAWAIVHGGKDVENRTQAWSYRGPLAIHAGARLSTRANDALVEALGDAMRQDRWQALVFGAIVGVVNLVDVHQAEVGCCESPWAETSYAEHGGRTRHQLVHLALEEPIALPEPVPCRGALGLWTVPSGVDEQVALQLDQAVGR